MALGETPRLVGYVMRSCLLDVPPSRSHLGTMGDDDVQSPSLSPLSEKTLPPSPHVTQRSQAVPRRPLPVPLATTSKAPCQPRRGVCLTEA